MTSRETREEAAAAAMRELLDEAVGRAARSPFSVRVVVEDGPDGRNVQMHRYTRKEQTTAPANTQP